MIECPRCGFNSIDGTERCIRCDADLSAKVALPETRRRLPALRMAAPLRLAAARMREHLFPPPDPELPVRTPFVAAALSLVPGCGQLYNHQRPMAFIHFFVFAALILVGIATIYSPISTVFFIGALLWINYSVTQAFQTAQLINGASFRWLQGARNYFLFLFLCAAFLALLQWLALGWIVLMLLVGLMGVAFALDQGSARGGYGKTSHKAWLIPIVFLIVNLAVYMALPGFFYRPIFSLRRIGQRAYAPLVNQGDRILYEGVWFGIEGPQLGDVVLYDPPRFSIEIPGDPMSTVYAINMTLNMERIVGMPGDTIERRGGEWFRNGKPAPPWEQPLVQDQLWDDLKLEVPEGHYGIMVSYGPSEWFIGERQAPSLKRFPVTGWPEASVIAPEKIFGRAICVYSPAAQRKWLTRGAARKQHNANE